MLDEDLQRILNVGAKIYNTATKKQGKVYSNDEVEIMVNYGRGESEVYPIEDFKDLLISDTIVSFSRITLGSGESESFKVKPREQISTPENIGRFSSTNKQIQTLPRSELTPPVKTQTSPVEILTEGYINFKTNQFSESAKKGYTKVEYKKIVEKVTVEVDSEMLEKLRELGLV